MVVATLLSLSVLSSLAAEEPAATDSLREIKMQFQQVFGEYKQAIQEIELLRVEYQSAMEGRRQEINETIRDKVSATRTKVDSMLESALAHHQLAPGEDNQITDLLVSIAAYDIRGVGPQSQGGDNYERALNIIDALVEGGVERPRLPVWGLLAAFACNDYEKAERFRQQAIDSEAFNVVPNKKDLVGAEILGFATRVADLLDDHRVLWEKELALRESEAADDDLPRVLLKTSEGDMVIELFETEAPTAVANFITLVKQGYYDGVKFHRVLPRFMAQGGDKLGTGMGGPGYTIKCECHQPNARMHFRGSLSMAHAGPDTGGSQFFLTFLPTDFLNGEHTVFGRVIEGIETLAELKRVSPGEGNGPESMILSATVLRDRGHDYSFEKQAER